MTGQLHPLSFGSATGTHGNACGLWRLRRHCGRQGLLEADVELESGVGGVGEASTPRKGTGRKQAGGRDRKAWNSYSRQGSAPEQVLGGVKVTQCPAELLLLPCITGVGWPGDLSTEGGQT